MLPRKKGGHYCCAVSIVSTLVIFFLVTNPSANAHPAPTSLWTVTNNADAGPGSLRQVLLSASNGDTVVFSPSVFPPSNPMTITLTSVLPTITQDNLTIDASNAGVILDGSVINGQGLGLGIEANGVTVRGLQIVNFSGGGIGIFGAHNRIGGDPGVGSGPFGQGNLVSKNAQGIGMIGTGTFSNTIQGNLIGVDPTGKLDWGNGGDGIHLNAAHDNLILDNVIGGNTMGIQGCCTSETSHNII